MQGWYNGIIKIRVLKAQERRYKDMKNESRELLKRVRNFKAFCEKEKLAGVKSWAEQAEYMILTYSNTHHEDEVIADITKCLKTMADMGMEV